MPDFAKQFNTNLSNEQEANYQLWLLEQSGKRGRDMSKDENDYDMRGYYKAGNGLDSGSGHFPDTFKKPNHPTFSNESIYHGAKAPGGGRYIGGQWKNIDGVDNFAPSPEMLNSTHNEKQLMQYFKRNEPDANLVLPPIDLSTGKRAVTPPSGGQIINQNPLIPASDYSGRDFGPVGTRNEGTLPTR